MDLPFDSIVVRQGEGETRMTVSQFLGLDLATRVRLVMTGSLSFFLSEVQVQQKDALGALQRLSAGRRSAV
jgi:hypothetical protein